MLKVQFCSHQQHRVRVVREEMSSVEMASTLPALMSKIHNSSVSQKASVIACIVIRGTQSMHLLIALDLNFFHFYPPF